MVIFLTFLCTMLVIAIFIIALWMWFFLDIFEQVAALIRIKMEEQVAIWRIESVSRIAHLEQQRERDKYVDQ